MSAPVSPEPAAPPTDPGVRIPKDPAERAALLEEAGLTDEERAAVEEWVVDTPPPTADVLRRLVAAVPGADGEIYCPSVDGCCFCGDCECDGIACIAALDPDDENDHEAIGQLHAWLRRGRLWEQAENFLAVQENRAGVRRG